ncbi:hypothetical protein HHI36_017064 [Cryptolaemus montrouzieri]|uniref:Uncharacterized protein n=1 Tax=Cryptolaemus montrouzieri TaxID=559131 RepID=A0ABD2NMB8_9CUCU
MMKNEIKVIYQKLNNININLKLKYDAMKQLCSYEELNRRCDGIFVGLDRTREIKRNKLIEKLGNLKEEREEKRVRVMENQFHRFHDNVVNYTGVQFENAEIEMLEKGLKHSSYLNSKREENLVNFTAEVELTVKNFLNNDVETK